MQQMQLIQSPVNDDRQTSDGPRSRKHARAETLSEVESIHGCERICSATNYAFKT